MSDPEPQPSAAADFDGSKLKVKLFRGPWFRTHRAAHGPLHFEMRSAHRFDAPGGAYGVLYLARKPAGAFVETFGHNADHHRVLSMSELAGHVLSKVDVTRPLRLLDLRERDLAGIGAEAEVIFGAPVLSQAWSAAVHSHPKNVDGIAYPALHDPTRTCAAIFDRAKRALTAISLGSFADKVLEREVARFLDGYDYGLV